MLNQEPSRPVTSFAGVSLFTFKKIRPWFHLSNDSVSVGGAYIGFTVESPLLVGLTKKLLPSVPVPIEEETPRIVVPVEDKPQAVIENE